jgi:multiple sugar transport system permease protein
MLDLPVSRKIAKRQTAWFDSFWKHRLAFLFLFPTILILVLCLISPILSGIYLSFNKISLQGISEFAGFSNYKLLLTESRFGTNVALSGIYIMGNLLLSLPLSYLAALMITRRLRGTLAIRSLFLLPWIVAPIVSAILFRSLVDPISGPVALLVNQLIGHEKVILANPTLAMVTIILHSFWRSFPFMMLFLAAGMMTIPREVYESAQIDGASYWHRFRFITLPLTKIHLAIVLLIVSMWTLQDVEGAFALTQGGPGYSTETTAVRLFKEAFINYNLNTGAAIGVLLLLAGLVFLTLYVRLIGRAEHAAG